MPSVRAPLPRHHPAPSILRAPQLKCVTRLFQRLPSGCQNRGLTVFTVTEHLVTVPSTVLGTEAPKQTRQTRSQFTQVTLQGGNWTRKNRNRIILIMSIMLRSDTDDTKGRTQRTESFRKASLRR